MAEGLWGRVAGTALIQLEGMGLERLLNALERAHIPLYAIDRQTRLRLRARVRLYQLGALERIAQDLHVHVHVVQRRGLAYQCQKLLGRRALFIALCACTLLAVASTQFVWHVRVTGLPQEQAARVLQAAQSLGYWRGALWGRLDAGEIERQMLLYTEDAARVLAHKRGVVLELEVVPFTQAPELFQKGQPCDVVADCDAIIDSIVALEGTPMVQVGDAVHPGDVLIRGTFERNYEEGAQRFVQARGVIVGRVSVTGTAEVPYVTEEPVETGNQQQVRTLQIGSFCAPLSQPLQFEDAILLSQSEQLLGATVLPARVVTRQYAEVKRVSRVRSYAETERQALSYAEADARAKLPQGAQIVKISQQSVAQDESVSAMVHLQYLIPIGKEQLEMDTSPLLSEPQW